MPYDTYLEKYADKFAILGGVYVQTALGLVPKEKLESEIRRVFELLKGKRWICCTTHFVQNHCSMEDLNFAFDLSTALQENLEYLNKTGAASILELLPLFCMRFSYGLSKG